MFWNLKLKLCTGPVNKVQSRCFAVCSLQFSKLVRIWCIFLSILQRFPRQMKCSSIRLIQPSLFNWDCFSKFKRNILIWFWLTFSVTNHAYFLSSTALQYQFHWMYTNKVMIWVGFSFLFTLFCRKRCLFLSDFQLAPFSSDSRCPLAGITSI